MNFIENLFKLKENNSDIKTELLAGLTTFFTMSYLFILSPKILENAGLDFNIILAATGIVTFLGCLLMGLIANKPYAVAPLVGETAFITYTLVCIMGISIKTVFASILICGILLFIMTLFNIRAFIVNKIPETIKLAFCSGLGLFFIFISLENIGIVKFTQNSIPVQTGNFTDLNVILGLFCFILIIILSKKKIKAAVLLSIIITTIIGILLNDVKMPSNIMAIPANISTSFMQFEFAGIFHKNYIAILFVIFLLVNIDTAGSLVSLSYQTNPSGNNMKKQMLADSSSVILASIAGTTTTGAYLDSITGIKAGGKTGLTAITVGFLFLFGVLFAPVISIIPAYAYAPALLYVGILMTSAITKIDFNDITEYAPAVITIAIMIFTYNIGTGIIAGFLIYPVIQLLCGQKQKTNIITWMMFVCAIIFFITYPY